MIAYIILIISFHVCCICTSCICTSTFFPSGWIWAQAVSSQNEASLSVIGGKFEISVFSPLSFVIYYRYRSPTAASVDIDNEIDSNYDVQVFRSTDLNRFKYRIDGVTGDSYIEAYSLLNDRKLVVRLSPSKSTSMQVNQSSCIPSGSDCINVSPYIVQSSLFGKPIHIPTANGFSNQPGCRETYTATAHVSLYRFNYSRMDFDLVHESRIDQSALEYGANFQGKVISNINGNE